MLLQGAAVRVRYALCSLGAGVAPGAGCGMSMAVWSLGPDRDDVYAVEKKGSASLSPKTIFCYRGLGSILP